MLNQYVHHIKSLKFLKEFIQHKQLRALALLYMRHDLDFDPEAHRLHISDSV